MKTLIIGCQTLQNELLTAIQKKHCDYPIIWIEAHLHNRKDKLRQAIQDILNQESSYERILLATGFCGNSIAGLQNRQATLIIPRVDDCISLLFGGNHNKNPWLDSYFLTEGWLKGQNNIWNEYQYALNKYGAKRAERIFHTMFCNYSRITLLDTGCYDLNPSFQEASKIAEAFSLDCQIVSVTTEYIEQLLTGPWETDRFLTVLPQQTITSASLSFNCGKVTENGKKQET